MNTKKIIGKSLIILASMILTLLIKSPIYLLMGLVWLVVEQLLTINRKVTLKLKQQQTLEEDFHEYLKNVILLTYTRPLKHAFKDSANTDNKKLNKLIIKFIDQQQYDFSVEPYRKLALKINKQKKGINYELNIMYLLYEIDKKGLGMDYINDILEELDLLIDNKKELNLDLLREDSYKYTLPPTILNFFYVSIILFEVVDNMIMGALQL